MNKNLFQRMPIVLLCCALVIGASITAFAAHQNNTYDFVINGISLKVDETYYKEVPTTDFKAELSITNNSTAATIVVLLASYSENGQMVSVQYQTKSFDANETVVCTFDVKNVDGNIAAIKAFLLNSKEELIPIARTFSFSNMDMVVSAYVNDSNELIVRTHKGDELVVNRANPKTGSFSDYEIGTKFHLEYPKGEFDIPVTVNNNTYTIHVKDIYYELTSINDISDPNAWTSVDYSTNGGSYFARYNLTMHINASTTPDLAGATVQFYFSDNMVRPNFGGTVAADGTISIIEEINQDGGQYWFSPRALYFWHTYIRP